MSRDWQKHLYTLAEIGEGKINQSNKYKEEEIAATTDPVAQETTTEQVTDPSTGGVDETIASTAEATEQAEQSATPEATTVSATTPKCI